MPASRRRSCGRCSSESISDPARTSKLKLSTRPAITASGRPKPARCLLRAGSAPEGGPPPGTCSMAVVGVTPATSTTGRTGRMHGEMPAKNPATMPTATSPTMTLSVLSPASHSLFGAGTGSVWSARQATSRSHGLSVTWLPNRANAWPARSRPRRRPGQPGARAARPARKMVSLFRESVSGRPGTQANRGRPGLPGRSSARATLRAARQNRAMRSLSRAPGNGTALGRSRYRSTGAGPGAADAWRPRRQRHRRRRNEGQADLVHVLPCVVAAAPFSAGEVSGR